VDLDQGKGNQYSKINSKVINDNIFDGVTNILIFPLKPLWSWASTAFRCGGGRIGTHG
jgi:hypothetical protein